MRSREGVISITVSRRVEKGDVDPIHRVMLDIVYNPFVREIRFGGAFGADTEALFSALWREEDVHARLVVVVPGMLDDQLVRAANVASHADEVIELGLPATDRNRFRKRNQHLLDACSMLLAFWNGDERSGTAMTMRMATKAGVPVQVVRLNGGVK